MMPSTQTFASTRKAKIFGMCDSLASSVLHVTMQSIKATTTVSDFLTFSSLNSTFSLVTKAIDSSPETFPTAVSTASETAAT